MSGESPGALAAEFAQICRALSVPKLTEELAAGSSIDHGHAISHWYSDPDFLMRRACRAPYHCRAEAGSGPHAWA